MRIAPADLGRLRQPELLEKVDRSGFRGFPAQGSADHRRLDHLVHEAVSRIEGSRSALSDVGDARASELPPLPFREFQQVHAIEDDLSPLEPTSGPGEAQGGEADRRLAGAKLADQSNNLATA